MGYYAVRKQSGDPLTELDDSYLDDSDMPGDSDATRVVESHTLYDVTMSFDAPCTVFELTTPWTTVPDRPGGYTGVLVLDESPPEPPEIDFGTDK